MTPLARLLAFPALVLTSLAATAAPVRYALDPVHTRVLFAVEHAGFSKALGTVSGSSGTLVFDPDDWAAATLEVTVPLRRADLGDAKWNEATLARNLLDAERFPDAHFVSTKVEASDAAHAKVTGNLTLHGVTRPVTLDVTLNALKRHPLPPFRRTAGFSATATLSRAAFGVDAWKSMIGDTVELRIEAEAVREGRADSDDDAGKTTEPAAPEQPAPATTDTESGR
ncbi:polyisoprenoid-binding protein [Xanthomonas campestris pv. campestris]|uniref:YceI family protein n=1 Tax=Xanthomonas campestris TaxID=339 RepID=UPI0023782A1F|nr:YceI family protein [Xanthomonas campestris]WDL68140.1 polyisoprenoid-binding protein [Xanthomonas campestris pv. campestris]